MSKIENIEKDLILERIDEHKEHEDSFLLFISYLCHFKLNIKQFTSIYHFILPILMISIMR